MAESVGIDRGEIPDLTRAPASLLEALESHLWHLEGGKGPAPTSNQQVSTINYYSLHVAVLDRHPAAVQPAPAAVHVDQRRGAHR